MQDDLSEGSGLTGEHLLLFLERCADFASLIDSEHSQRSCPDQRSQSVSSRGELSRNNSFSFADIKARSLSDLGLSDDDHSQKEARIPRPATICTENHSVRNILINTAISPSLFMKNRAHVTPTTIAASPSHFTPAIRAVSPTDARSHLTPISMLKSQYEARGASRRDVWHAHFP